MGTREGLAAMCERERRRQELLEAGRGRDLAADMAVCDAATEGPWECRHPLDMSRQPAPSPSVIGPADKSPTAWCYGSNFADGDFIAAAREGWPQVIVRCEDAEFELGKLRAAVRRHRAERDASPPSAGVTDAELYAYLPEGR
jgi:hypothetical protein